MRVLPCGVVGVLLGASALSGAGVAVAEPPLGSYTATVTGALGAYNGAQSSTWVFTSCGPDCVQIDRQGAVLHPEGDRWTGTFELHAADNGEVVVCTRSVTPALTATDFCPQPVGIIVNYQLTKIG